MRAWFCPSCPGFRRRDRSREDRRTIIANHNSSGKSSFYLVKLKQDLSRAIALYNELFYPPNREKCIITGANDRPQSDIEQERFPCSLLSTRIITFRLPPHLGGA